MVTLSRSTEVPFPRILNIYLVEAAEGRHVLGIEDKIKDAEVLHYPVPLGALRDDDHPELDQVPENDLGRRLGPPFRHVQHSRVFEKVVHDGVLAGAQGARVFPPPVRSSLSTLVVG